MSSILLSDRNVSLQPLPDVTADRRAQFFIDKVNGVRAATENAAPPTYTTHAEQHLCSFREVSVDDVRKVLLNSPPKNLCCWPTTDVCAA